MTKTANAYKTIGEVAKLLSLNSKEGRSISTHTIRFWEKEFKQLKPKIFNGNRRYYDEKNINILKKIKFLLKDQGMTIKGAKLLMNDKETLKLDEITNKSIKAYNLRNKVIKISNIIKSLKELK